MKPAARSGFVILLSTSAILALIALPALAYQYPLSSSDIRNAYLLGYAKDLNTAGFFTQYVHEFPVPETGPHVAKITLKTPYSQIVELGQSAMNADVQGAEEEYATKKLPFLVQVGVDLTPTYPDSLTWGPTAPGFPLPDFQRDFPVQLIQKDKKIGERSTQIYLLYSEGDSNTYEVSGAIIEYRYDPDKIDPDDEMTIAVQTPDNQDVETTFDLGHLR